MLKYARTLGIAAALGFTGVAAPRAAGMQTVPTELDFDACTIISSNDFGTLRACPGYKGIPVMLEDDNGRFTVSFGLKSTEERAARQPLPRRGHPDGAIAWRLSNESGRWTPVAAIMRFALDSEGKAPAAVVLTVTRVAEEKTCVVGYVDATSSVDAALPIAEAMADKAASFDCSTEPEKAAGFKAW